MVKRAFCYTVVLLLAVTGAGAQSWTDISTDRAVLTSTDAFVLRPAELVLGSRVMSALWSRTGSALLIWQVEPYEVPDLWTFMQPDPQALPLEALRPARASTFTLYAWSARSSETRKLLSIVSPTGPPAACWLGRTHTILITSTEPLPSNPPPPLGPPDPPSGQRFKLYRVNAVTGRVETLETPGRAQDDHPYVSASPVDPVGVVYWHTAIRQEAKATNSVLPGLVDTYRTTFCRIGSSGAVQHLCDVPQTREAPDVSWAVDGSLTVSAAPSAAVEGVKARHRRQRLDVATGELTDLAEEPRSRLGNADTGLRIARTEAGLSPNGATPSVPVLWLRATAQGSTRAFLASEASDAQIAPDASAVVYHGRGALWMTRLQHIDRATFDAGWNLVQERYREATQLTLLSNGRQLGLGVMVYANDHEGHFPTQDGFTDNILASGYAPSLLAGFVYELDGTALKDIDSPATTEIGYIPGPGGRVVIFADGRAHWLDDKPSPPP